MNSEENQNNVRLKAKLDEVKKKHSGLRNENELLKLELNDTLIALERYKLIADFAHDWEMWYGPDGTVEYVSPSFQSVTGYASEELIARPVILDQIIYPEDLEAYRKFVSDSLNFISIRQSFSFRILTRTKQVRWCEIKCKAVYDKRGKYLGQRVSINDITRLMQALGEIKNLSDGKQYEVMAKQKYMRDLESKDRELVSYLMAISQKNETLQYTRKQIQLLMNSLNEQDKDHLSQVVSRINSALIATETWDNFKMHFEKIHQGFFERLSNDYPALSPKDKKLCAFLRLQLTTKEIAVLMNITFQSAEISRVRLRKKLELTRDVNLVDFIMKV